MPAPPPHDRRCDADPDCRRPPRFQAQLHRVHPAPGPSLAVKTADTCADHLGDTVQALREWAGATGFDNGILQFSVVGSPAEEQGRRLPAFPFATIPLPA